MTVRSQLRKTLRPLVGGNRAIKSSLKDIDIVVDRTRHAIAKQTVKVIKPEPRKIFITLTANCDNRCKGCHYGREFMKGHQLPLETVTNLLDDAKTLGIERVRLYGGEPLLHKKLPEIVQHCSELGLNYWMTTNGVRLQKKIDALYDAGLRNLSIGLYGTGEDYDAYVQKNNQFEKVEAGIRYTRERYGSDITMNLDWLLMKPTGTVEKLNEMLTLSQRYEMPFYVNLIHYSLPYFTGPEESELQFTPEDKPHLEEIVQKLLAFKQKRPDLVKNSEPGLRSIPDWILKGPNMRVPCTGYRLIWIGADGTVQMCYVTFKLGNLHEKRLTELLYTPKHDQAAQDAFNLNCPNCHCMYDARTIRHGPTLKQYT